MNQLLKRNVARLGAAGAAIAAMSAGSTVGGPVNVEQLRRVLEGGVAENVIRGEPTFTEEFFLDECSFRPKGANLFFSLRAGYQLHLAGDDDGEMIDLYITVLDETRVVEFEVSGVPYRVRTRVIEEREYIDGELYEISRNFYARCRETGSVFYFGEDVCFFEDDECVSDSGSWLAGVDGAAPGVIMPGTWLLGARYYQEIAPGVALDRAEHTQMGVTIQTPAGLLENCVVVLEDSPLDAGATSEKVYAPGIGLVKDGPIELVSYGYIDEAHAEQAARDIAAERALAEAP